MPTRIRSNGMSIALVLNQIVSTTLAAIFLPVVGKYGYSTMFYLFAGFTVVYFADRSVLPAGDKGKDAGGDRTDFRSQRSTGPVADRFMRLRADVCGLAMGA